MKWLRNDFASSESLSAEAIIAATVRPTGVANTVTTCESCLRSDSSGARCSRGADAELSLSISAAIATACRSGHQR